MLAPPREKEHFSKSKFGVDSSDSAWVLLGHGFIDFDESHANLQRMVREGEEQNADVVSAMVRYKRSLCLSAKSPYRTTISVF